MPDYIPKTPGKPEATSFEKWYRTYPRKVSRGSAEKTWAKITKGMTKIEEEEFSLQLRNAIKAQIAHYKSTKESGDFVPDWKHPSTWLNGMCWEDELDSYIRKNGSPMELKGCMEKDCSEKVHGPLFSQCAYHFSMNAVSERGNIVSGDDLRDYLRNSDHLKRKKGEMVHQWIGRLRRFTKARISDIGGS